jgi:hypothetical protein
LTAPKQTISELYYLIFLGCSHTIKKFGLRNALVRVDFYSLSVLKYFIKFRFDVLSNKEKNLVIPITLSR